MPKQSVEDRVAELCMEYVCVERASSNPDRRKLLQLKMKIIGYIGDGNTQIELDAARATYRMMTGDKPQPRQDRPMFDTRRARWGPMVRW